MHSIRKFVVTGLVLATVAILSVCAAQIASVPAQAAQMITPKIVAVCAQETAENLKAITLPGASDTMQPVTPLPTVVPTQTSAPLPCDFMTADFSGKAAPVLERLLNSWGFGYFTPDGKWTAADAYELSLFQRWYGLKPTGKIDVATRQAMLSAYIKYSDMTIPRQKLPLEGRYIGINAGHQQKGDYGTEPLSPEPHSPVKAKVSSGTAGVSTRVPEYKVTLAVALKLRDMLEAKGARVIMVRTVNNVRISNVERCRLMNNAGVDVFISLHCDGNNNHKIHGLHTLIPADRGYQHGAVLKKSQILANKMQAEEIKATGTANKGFSTRRDLSSFNWAKMPTCLVEMGFMTYPAEDRLLNTASYQEKLAKGIVAGFIDYYYAIK